MIRRLGGSALLLAAVACARVRPEAGAVTLRASSSASACAVPVASSPLNIVPTTLAGQFTIEMAATSGARAGSRTTGTLRLGPVDSSGTIAPLSATPRELITGVLTLDLTAIGAQAPGAPLPGGARHVSVVQWRAGPGDIQVMMRVGAATIPPSGTITIEGTYFSLTVQSVTSPRVAGIWTSGSGLTQSGGFFCADRID